MNQYASQILLNHVLDDGKNKEVKRTIINSLGYKNINKGFRRLYKSMHEKHLDIELLNKIPELFKISKETIALVIETTENQFQEEEQIDELIERLNFKPFLWKKHERKIPSSIFVVAISGIKGFKYIKLPENLAEETLFNQLEIIEKAIKNDLETNRAPKFFGEITGYYYRKTYDETLEFSIEGKLIGKYDGIVDTKEATLSFKGRDIGCFMRKETAKL